MTLGEYEPVTIRPDRIAGVESQESLPQRVGDGRHAHWSAGMPGVGLLDRVHTQASDRIDGQLVKIRHIDSASLGMEDQRPRFYSVVPPGRGRAAVIRGTKDPFSAR